MRHARLTGKSERSERNEAHPLDWQGLLGNGGIPRNLMQNLLGTGTGPDSETWVPLPGAQNLDMGPPLSSR